MTFQPTSTTTGLPAAPSLFAEYLARDRAFKFIGPVRANALVEALGSDLREAILSLDDRVVDIIGEAPAINAAAVLEARLPETEFLAWLVSVGADIPIYKAVRIARAWGEQGTKAVKQNPYLLLAVSDWKTADRLAASIGISKQDPGRQIAAIEAALMGKGGLDSGFTLMSQEHALRRAQRLSGRRIDPGMVDRAVLVLAGYAGSGKTTVLKGICDTQEAIGKAPLIITLSGRAAQRASEATGRRAITVARFLIEVEKSSGPLGSDRVLIADEASMLGLVELWRILRRLGEASLVLCGDPAQLPPVSPGVVFHHLAADPDTRKVVLDRVHRQNESSGIPSLAEGVRNGFIGDLPRFPGAKPGVSFHPCGRDDFCDEIMRIGKELSDSGNDRSSVQIIAPTNREIGQINAYFHDRILKKRPRLWPETRHMAEGEPVIWTQNDPKRGLTNGALGRIIKIDGEAINAEFDGTEHELQQQDGQYLQLAWAISVHKAQGSQWSRVIIPVFQSMIVDRSLIYTALTRAQEQVILVGSLSAARRAVERRPKAEMGNCGFPAWLKLARRIGQEAQVI